MTPGGLSPLACRVLRRFLPAHWRDSVEGDLLEEQGRRQRAGQHTGLLWQVPAVLITGLRLAIEARATVVARQRRGGVGRSAEMWRSDFVFAVRGLVANRGCSVLAVATLALAIGANAAVFNLANWLVFRPVPGVDRPRDLVGIRLGNPDNSGSIGAVSPLEVRTIGDGTPSLEGLTGYVSAPIDVNIEAPGRPARRLGVEFVMVNYFDVLRARIEGRGFTADEVRLPAVPAVVVISEGLRRREFADRAPIGRTLKVNGQQATIVGVAPPGFRGTRLLKPVDLWAPVAQRFLALPASAKGPPIDEGRILFAMAGRLKSGVTIDTLQQQLDHVKAQMAAADPSSTRFATRRFNAEKHMESASSVRGELAQVFGLLLAGSWLLVLLACANVGNVLLARAASRAGEIATRLALGATRWQIARLLVSESLLISSSAAGIALVLTWLVAGLFDGTVVSPTLPPLDRPSLDWRVVGWSIAAAAITAIATSLWPMWSIRSMDTARTLQSASRSVVHSRQWLRRGLMVAQVAASLVLVVCAGLLVRSIGARLAIDPGYEAGRVFTFRLDPRPTDRSKPAHAIRQQLVDRLRETPGVAAASLAFLPPFNSGHEARLVFKPEGGTDGVTLARNSIRPGFFATLGQPFIAGRDFTEAEANSAEPPGEGPVIFPASVARRIFGTTDVVGRAILDTKGSRRTIVGVVRDARQRNLIGDDSLDIAFEPYRPSNITPFITLVVRSNTRAADLWPQLRRAVADVEPGLAIFEAKSALEGIRLEFGDEIMLMRIASASGALAVLLAASGLYGVLARSLAERRREIGIRTALGATPLRVVTLISREALGVLTVGLCLGLAACIVCTRFLDEWLYGVTPLDARAFLGGTVLIVVVMAVASIAPFRRATRCDPATVLRTE